MQPLIPIKIFAYLNQGDVVIAEVHSEVAGARCFVSIRPRPNPKVPREEHRYLNSRFTMWEYWHFQFRRMVLRPGWEAPEFYNDYDLFLLLDEKCQTQTETGFYALLTEWVPDLSALKHIFDSDCPE